MLFSSPPPQSCTAFDPFTENLDPRRYRSRPATERVLDKLEKAVRDNEAGVLAGPSGIGKSMVLRVLAQRVRSDYRVVQVPFGGLSAAEICTWALDGLRAAKPEADPELELCLLAADQLRRGAAIVLMIDAAHSLSLEDARRLSGLCESSGGGLRLVAALTDPEPPLLRILTDGAQSVWLRQPLELRETGDYIRSRLEMACAPPAIRCLFDGPTMLRLQRESEGIPALLNDLASDVIEQAVRTGSLPADAHRLPRRPTDAPPRATLRSRSRSRAPVSL